MTVRPDGTGDYPTLNAAVQAMMSSYVADTILVEPGYYDETVNDSDYFGFVIHGRAGAESTRVREFVSLPERASYTGTGYGKAVGLRIEQTVNWGRNSSMLRWEDCIFQLGYIGSDDLGRGFPVRSSVFRDSSSFVGFGYDLIDCSFEAAPVHVQNLIGSARLLRCTFRGPAGDLARVTPRDQSNVVFEECTFANAGNGVVVNPLRYSQQLVDIRRCRFEHLTGAALRYTYGNPAVAEIGSLRLTLENSVLADVGQVVRCLAAISVNLNVLDDTVQTTQGTAIEATVRRCTVSGLLMSDAGGSGLLLRNQTVQPDPKKTPPNMFSITDSHISRCAGDGISIQQLPTPTWGPQDLAVRNTVIERCGGSGIAFTGTSPVVTGCLLRENGGDGLHVFGASAAPTCSLVNNTSVGNSGRGVIVESAAGMTALAVRNNLLSNNQFDGLAIFSTYTGIASFNDAWANGASPFVGMHPDEVNIESDPLYCMPTAGDFSLRSDSPCAPSGTYGSIGALGVGCEVKTEVELLAPAPAPLRIWPNPARETVSFTWVSGDPPGELAILDLHGRLRWNAPVGPLDAGTIRWEPRGFAGEALPPGIYFVRWRRGGEIGGARLVLLGR
ncbi:MAG: right-handed parallel beta-helix repeat-containing protein [Candidatus Eisenbacteria bacterium]